MGFLARARAAVIGGIVLLVVAGPAFAAQRGVTIQDLSYSPRTITIDAGDVVTWTNLDGRNQHSVTATNGEFDSSPNCPGVCLHDGDSYSVSFGQPGTYHYYCRVHGDAGNPNCAMCGAVVVRGAGRPVRTAAPTTRPATTYRPGTAATGTAAPATSSPTATPAPSATPKQSAAPALASPIAAPPPAESKSGHGAALAGVIIAGLILDAGAVLAYRRRRAAG
jgi:plastocyanin